MSNQALIKINNYRELNFYIAYLRSQNIFPPTIRHDNLKLASEAISNTLSKKKVNNDFILDMKLTYDNVILPEDSFEWLDEDKRALFYFWGCLKFRNDLNDFINTLMPLHSDNWHEKANITNSSFNHKERLILVKSFFDFLCIEKKILNLLTASCNHFTKHGIDYTQILFGFIGYHPKMKMAVNGLIIIY